MIIFLFFMLALFGFSFTDVSYHAMISMYANSSFKKLHTNQEAEHDGYLTVVHIARIKTIACMMYVSSYALE